MRRLILMLVLLWLPLQGMAALIMPFCKQAHSPAMGHAGQHEHGPGDQHQPPAPHACDDCGVCHLACSPGLPCEAALHIALPATEHARCEPRGQPGFISDLPQRPPLARA